MIATTYTYIYKTYIPFNLDRNLSIKKNSLIPLRTYFGAASFANFYAEKEFYKIHFLNKTIRLHSYSYLSPTFSNTSN